MNRNGAERLLADPDRLLSRLDLTSAAGVTPQQAAVNAAIGRGPRKARPGRHGLLGVSEATFDRWVANRIFLQPIRLGPRTLRWRAADVERWLSAKGEAS